MKYFILLLLVPLLQCSQKRAPEINRELLINKFWIHNLTPDSNTIFPLNHQMIWKFDSISLYQDSGQIGDYIINRDTLTIFETDPNQTDSLLKEIYCRAKIEKSTTDSLHLFILMDNPYFKKNQYIAFFHEQLNYDSALVINKISLSTTDCSLGECPVMKLELLPDRSIYFEGMENTRQFKGKFQGIIADSIYQKIENNLKLANLTTMDTLLPGIIDGQSFELVIHYNNKQQKKINGGINHFFTERNDIKDVAGYRRLQGAIYWLTRLHLHTPLQKSDIQNKISPPDENSEK